MSTRKSTKETYQPWSPGREPHRRLQDQCLPVDRPTLSWHTYYQRLTARSKTKLNYWNPYQNSPGENALTQVLNETLHGPEVEEGIHH